MLKFNLSQYLLTTYLYVVESDHNLPRFTKSILPTFNYASTDYIFSTHLNMFREVLIYNNRNHYWKNV